MNFIEKYFSVLGSLVIEMAPWLLLGFLFSGILKAFLPTYKIQKFLGKKGFRANLNAALFGVPMPLCSCGVIPTAISLHKSGATKGATNSFLISTPQTGVDSFFATYALMGLPFAILRPFIAFSTGILGGILTDKTQKNDKEVILEEPNFKRASKSFQEKIKETIQYGFVEMIQDIAKWLIVGLLLAALISALIPDTFFQEYIGNIYLEFLIVLAISIPLYVCATGSIPIALILLLKGISPGAAILFLMAGPATNIATITVILKTMGKRSLFAYLFSIIFGALFFSVLVNMFIPQEWILSQIPFKQEANHQEITSSFIGVGMAIFLITLLLYNLIQPYMKKKNKKISQDWEKITVKGMTCNHCKSSVENSLKKISGIEEVQAILTDSEVRIKGVFEREKIISIISQLGFEAEDQK